MSRRVDLTFEFYDADGNLVETKKACRTVFIDNDSAGRTTRYIRYRQQRKVVSATNVVRFYKKGGKRMLTLPQMNPGIDDRSYA